MPPSTSTYSGDPSTSPMDAVRFLIHDTSSPWQFSDAEVNWAVAEAGDTYRAAAQLCWRLFQRFLETSGQEKSVGDLRIARRDGGQTGIDYRALAKELERVADLKGIAAPTANPAALGAEFQVGKMDWVDWDDS